MTETMRETKRQCVRKREKDEIKRAWTLVVVERGIQGRSAQYAAARETARGRAKAHTERPHAVSTVEMPTQ